MSHLRPLVCAVFPENKDSSHISRVRIIAIAVAIACGLSLVACDSGQPPAGGKPAVAPAPAAVKYQPPPPEKGLPASMQDVVAVDVRETVSQLDKAKVATGILFRELGRQAVFLAARDQLGLATRDVSLREEIALRDDPSTYPVQLTMRIGEDRTVTLECDGYDLQKRRVRKDLGDFRLPESNILPGLTERLEPLTRAELPNYLKGLGYLEKAGPRVADAAVNESIERLLEKMDFISQFTALRELHQAMRRDGDSAWRLGALARAYANLGSLTELLWSPAHKVFKARALLYAERLVAREHRSASALANRAYVRALVGLHQSALDDLKDAREIIGGGAMKLPNWAEAIRAFCAYEPELLATVERESGNAELVPYLTLLTNEHAGNIRLRLQAASDMTAANGDCDRAVIVIGGVSAVGLSGMTSRESLRWFARRLYPRLAAVRGLPAEVGAVIQEATSKLKLEETGQDEDENPEDGISEIESRKNLLMALHDAGNPENDSTEPSWQVLEQFIRDVGFVLVWHALDYESNMLGVSPDATNAALRPLVDDHSYRWFIDTFVSDPRHRREAAQELMKSIDIPQLEFTELPVDDVLNRVLPPNTPTAMHFEAALSHRDEVFRDLVKTAHLSVSAGFAAKSWAAVALRTISPHLPATISASTKHHWTYSSEHAAEWEKRYAKSSEALSAVALLYQNLEQIDDCERCLTQLLEIAPVSGNYVWLAHIQERKNKLDEWQRNLEAALELPAIGLEHAQIQVELADHFMAREDWERALPYAIAAAESYAGWALDCAGRCYEALQDWQTSEAYFRAMAERYEGSQMDWYLWCRRTGHGDIEAARALAQQALHRNQDTEEGGGLQSGVFQEMEGLPEQALETVVAQWESRQDRYSLFHGFLLADEIGQRERRDALLRTIALNTKDDADLAQKKWRTRLFPLFRTVLEARNPAVWNSGKFEDLLLETEYGDVTTLYFFAGRFLALRGESELSRRYLQRAATSPIRNNVCCTLANFILRKQDVAIGPMRGLEMERDRHRLSNVIRKGNFERYRGMHSRAVTAYTKALALDPVCRPALLGRAKSAEEIEDFDLAVADCDLLLKESPKDGELRKRRAQMLGKTGDHAGAIASFEALLSEFPDWTEGHRDLAWLLATCPNQTLRNASQAIEHAEQAAKLSRSNPAIHAANLAAAHAEAGHFEKAAEYAAQALRAARPGTTDATEAQRQLDLYRQGKKYEPPTGKSDDGNSDAVHKE